MPPDTKIVDLKARIRFLESRIQGKAGACRTISFGDPGIDRNLPWGGLPRGALHEVAGPAGDAAADGFCTALAARLAAGGGTVLWCQQRLTTTEAGLPYGAGLAGFGLAGERLVLFRGAHDTDVLWAAEEGLRHPGLAVVLAEVEDLDLTQSRRLQLAAEASGVTAIVRRLGTGPLAANAALTRWRVAAAPSAPDRADDIGAARWSVDLYRCRGGAPRSWLMEWQDEALRFAVAAALADRPSPAPQPAAALG